MRRSALPLLVLDALVSGCLVSNPLFDGDDASDGAAATAGTSTGGAAATDPTASTAPTDGTAGASGTATGGGSLTGDGVTGSTGSTTAAPPTCADLECDDNATCQQQGDEPSCVCNTGFDGDGATCTDIDECTQGVCPGLCVNGPGDFACLYPATCAELRDAAPGTPDGPATLYVDGDPAKPWTAYCHDMAGTPREYLTLPRQGFGVNTGRYVGLPGDGETTTRYQRIRVDPTNWLVDTTDDTFSEKVGNAVHGGGPVTEVAYGAAMTCFYQQTTANIDLRDTPFRPENNFCTGGYQASGMSQSPQPQVFNNTGSGGCGWQAPAVGGCPFNPINGEGKSLRLIYLPP